MLRALPLVTGLALSGCAGGGDAAGVASDWRFEQLDTVGGHPTTVLGQPRLSEGPGGPAVAFDGVDDALLLDVNPLEGAEAFTVEVLFRPEAGGPDEQRFLHLQETGSKDRVLLETRLTPDGRWFLDTYVKTGDKGHTLYAKDHLHAADRWYHAALVVADGTMRHFVDGQLELARSITFRAQSAGRTSIGVRINLVSWFKGRIRRIRITPRALRPDEFFEP